MNLLAIRLPAFAVGLALLLLALPASAHAQQFRLATVNMKKVFENHYRTKDSEERLNSERATLQKEADERKDAFSRVQDELAKLNKALEKADLSGEDRQATTTKRDEKLEEVQSLQQEIAEFQETRTQQIEQQIARLRGSILSEIDAVLKKKIEAEQYDLVLDSSGEGAHRTPVVLYVKETYDITSEVILEVNKNQKALAPVGIPPKNDPQPVAVQKKP